MSKSKSTLIPVPKYKYLLQTWGALYFLNEAREEGLESGYHLFNTSKERQAYIDKLEDFAIRHNNPKVMLITKEGYACEKFVTLHRVIKFEGKEYHTTSVLGSDFSYAAAVYYLKHKWTPGFNDYPLGEDFDYDERRGEIEIVQEWITGAFILNKTTK